MKSTFRKIFLLTATVILTVMCLAFSASAKTYGDFTYRILPDYTIEITAYNGKATAIEVPAKIKSTKVTTIGYSAFENNKTVKSVTLPDTVRAIGSDAFSGCTKLSKINIPDSVTEINYHAFGDCTSLKNLTIPGSVTNIDSRVFENCAWYSSQPDGFVYAGKVLYVYKGKMPKNTSLKVKDGTKAFAKYALQDQTNLVSVTIPDSVTEITYGVFSGCENLRTVNLPKSLKRINSWAFQSCEKLSEINLNSVERVGENAFYNTDWYNSQPKGVVYIGKSLYKYKGTMPKNTSVKIKSGTKYITWGAFRSCTGLKSVTFPDSLISIEPEVFSGCKNLQSVSLPKNLESVGPDVFYNCTKLESVTASDSIKTIGMGAFKNTAWYDNQPDGAVYIGKVLYSYKGDGSDKTSFKIKKGTVSVTQGVFDGCTKLKTVTLYKGMSEIVLDAFAGCSSITDVYFYGTRAQWKKIAIDEGNEYLTGAKIHFMYPGTPKNTKTLASSVNIKLSWDKAVDADGYAVYQYTENGWKRIKTITSADTTSCKVKNLDSGTTYKFRIKAYNKAKGETFWSEATKTIKVTTLT